MGNTESSWWRYSYSVLLSLAFISGVLLLTVVVQKMIYGRYVKGGFERVGFEGQFTFGTRTTLFYKDPSFTSVIGEVLDEEKSSDDDGRNIRAHRSIHYRRPAALLASSCANLPQWPITLA